MAVTFSSTAAVDGRAYPSVSSGIQAETILTEPDPPGTNHLGPVTVPASSTVELTDSAWTIAKLKAGGFGATGALVLETDDSGTPTESISLTAGWHNYPSAAAFPFTDDATALFLTNSGEADVVFEGFVRRDLT